MTIDRMDTRVDVTPSSKAPGAGAVTPTGGPGSPQPTSPQGTAEILKALRPLVIQIVEDELRERLRIAGVG